MRQRLVRRLRSLWTFELLNAVVIFPGLILVLWQSFQIGGFTVYTTALAYSSFGLPQSGEQPAPFGFTGELHHCGLHAGSREGGPSAACALS
jgi:hypothetical protein